MLAPIFRKGLCAFSNGICRRNNKEGAATVGVRSNRNGVGPELPTPVVNLQLVTTGKSAVVMVDHRRPAGRQCSGFADGHLLTKLTGVLSVRTVVDQAVV